MNDIATLKSLEGLLEAFLTGVVILKQDHLKVVGGINRLDDIATYSPSTDAMGEAVGEWFAEHNQWLKESVLSDGEIGRIGNLLENIKDKFDQDKTSTPERRKLSTEIDRWTNLAETIPHKLVLKRPAETSQDERIDTITMYGNMLEDIYNLFKDKTDGKKHLLSVLDDALKSAYHQKNKSALLLSAYIIYYLKLDEYLVEPYVRRLKQAEQILKGENDA